MKTLRHYTSNPTVVEVNGKIYRFVPKYGVSLCFDVPDEDADIILGIKAKACCNKVQSKFILANQNSINVWNDGHI